MVNLLPLVHGQRPVSCRRWGRLLALALTAAALVVVLLLTACTRAAIPAVRLTLAARINITLGFTLSVALGALFAALYGFDPFVLVAGAASASLGCVGFFVSLALRGAPLRAAFLFSAVVSVGFPLGFGVGFGVGLLFAVLLGTEQADDVLRKADHFVAHLRDFAVVAASFALTGA